MVHSQRTGSLPDMSSFSLFSPGDDSDDYSLPVPEDEVTKKSRSLQSRGSGRMPRSRLASRLSPQRRAQSAKIFSPKHQVHSKKGGGSAVKVDETKQAESISVTIVSSAVAVGSGGKTDSQVDSDGKTGE